jgi:hypothetical protein
MKDSAPWFLFVCWLVTWLVSLNIEMNFWVCFLSARFDIHRFKICSNETGQKRITKLLS